MPSEAFVTNTEDGEAKMEAKATTQLHKELSMSSAHQGGAIMN